MFGFNKQLRLNQAAEFRQLFRAGKKLNTHYFAIYHYPNQLTHPRVGLVVAKKAVRSAVKRNQIKRITRESFRLQQEKLVGLDVMIVAYRGIADINKAALRTELERGWLKLLNTLPKKV